MTFGKLRQRVWVRQGVEFVACGRGRLSLLGVEGLTVADALITGGDNSGRKSLRGRFVTCATSARCFSNLLNCRA